ncbi:hypothetical protein EC991_006745 [Linnemannia zychae]|nr:hypothetical protein EC991_006745 [Linnemannia zychae]
MILSIPFWILAVIITLIKVILSGAIGAIITFYVGRSHVSGYASSIRWSRTGGVLEAGILLWNSRRHLPTRSSIAMASLILASLFTLVISILLGALVSRSDKPFNDSSVGVYTEQLISADPIFWTASIEADAEMNETLISILNDTRRNPNPVPRTRYTPRTYDYEIPCKETTVIFGSSFEDLLVFPSEVSCKSAIIIISTESYNWSTNTTSRDLIAPNTIMIATPVVYDSGGRYFEMPQPYFIGVYKSKTCTQSPGNDPGVVFKIRPKDGLSSPPMTVVTKCWLGSGDPIVISGTYFHFAVSHVNDFSKVATSIFFDDLDTFPLVHSMSGAINNGAFSDATNNRTMVALINNSTNTDILVCISTLLDSPSNDMGLLCTYLVTKMIVSKPQEWDPILVERLNRISTPSVESNSNISKKIDLSIHHSPKTSGSQDTSAMYSTAHLRKATNDAAEYLASLGHNVFVDDRGRTESEGLYILYDTIEFQDAFEVPTVSVVVIGVITLICAVIWGISEVAYKTAYNGSLYKVIYEQIKLKDETTPMLMEWTPTPLAFDGHQVFPDQDEQLTLSSDDSPEDTHNNASVQEIASTIESATVMTDNNNNSYHAGTIYRSSYVPRPINPPPVPPRPYGNRFNPVPPSSTHEYLPLSPLPQTNSYTLQISQPPPPPPLPPQKSTPIQSPFW